MKLLTIIPARGGSKRVPGKNLRLLGDRPLVQWSIESAKGMQDVSDILLTTDDPLIASAGRAAGATVPWLRPALLATDTASSVDVCLHALDWYEANVQKVDGLLLLQPTSPFRRKESLESGCQLFESHGLRPVVGVSPASSHPMWCFRTCGDSLSPFMPDFRENLRSQDLPPAYTVNGAFYLITPGDLREHRRFLLANTVPLVMDEPEAAVDIDTEWDWQIASAIVDLQSRAGRST
jgi:N-acylneuraminate cytidylyltransferase